MRAALMILPILAGIARAANPTVIVDTSAGKFEIELLEDKAPNTVKNFLVYVDEKYYDGTIIHRAVPGFGIQGGGHEPNLKEKKGKPPIKNESQNGVSNLRGTVAAARPVGNPHGATSQFFINVVDNAWLDKDKAADKFGYCVFGKVTAGIEIVDRIANTRTSAKKDPAGHLRHEVPVEDVVIKSIRRKDESK